MPKTDIGTFYLASASPRRKELLNGLRLQFQVALSKGPELAHPRRIKDSKHLAVVMKIAEAKLRGAWDTIQGLKGKSKRGASGLILAADTLVFIGEEVLGKPKDPKEAKRMLRKLSGATHTVATGISLARFSGDELDQIENRMVTTSVTFLPLHDTEIDWYISTKEPMDKAGAYGAQGIGAALIAEIKGSYTNVVGLPLAETTHLISEVGGMPWQMWTK